MSPKQWFALLAFYISYLFFGASVFYHQEHRLETERRSVALAERIEINALLVKYLSPDNNTLQNELLQQVSDYCEQPVTNPATDDRLWQYFSQQYLWANVYDFLCSSRYPSSCYSLCLYG